MAVADEHGPALPEPHPDVLFALRLVDATALGDPLPLADTGRPVDGYMWSPTPQYEQAFGFWKAMADRHHTGFAADREGVCPHLHGTPGRSVSN